MIIRINKKNVYTISNICLIINCFMFEVYVHSHFGLWL